MEAFCASPSMIGRCLLILWFAAQLGSSFAAEPVPIETVEVADGIYMLIGRGGNIGVSVGDDGVFMIDDQYAPQTPAIKSAIAAITDRDVRFVINTHWHGDHTGGNENFGTAGAVIVAHENVRKRLSSDQFIEFFKGEAPASPVGAWPVITFTRDITFHLNGDTIEVFHVANAHTDGDAIVHFKRANVFHMGDVSFEDMYPFIDTSTGGSVGGVIAAVDSVLEMCDDDTRIISGHGPLSDKAGLAAYRRMLNAVRNLVAAEIASGKTEDQIVAANPTKAFDAKYGEGFLSPEKFVRIVYRSLVLATLIP